ncbi:hypothetical protein B7P43_G16371 [Cryptotermes secundus]|uniref:SGNH hydrolase-type esterase domain-containing protein n=1 Tax=Cryptotermes secundus TaxID=105785 RepID=A0A2J7QWQ5_9NEOP|nr:hypothetical protein B7P43_G16371 [Cryptotermes secundus]
MQGKGRKKKDNIQNLRHKILVVGDSHVRGMAAKLRDNLGDHYSVQGLVKPGADLAAVLSSGVKETKDFSKKDVVIVWGGTNDVSRNETDKGLIEIRNFVIDNAHTNVLVVNLPNRMDLEATSCVNQEIKVFNRKLRKYMKVFDYASTLEIKFERDQYTRHGLHLNTKGKDLAAKLLKSTINNIFNVSKVTPITMNWVGKHVMPCTKNAGKTGKQLDDNSESVISQVETPQQIVPSIRITGRERKIPVTRTNDFLW